MTVQLDLFVASKIGSFKHLRYDSSKKKCKGSSRNLQDIKLLKKGEGICSMSWYNDDQTEVILSRQNRTLQIFDIRAEEFTNNREITFGNGKPHSVCVSAEIVACATESGIVKIWKKDCYDEGREMNVGSDLEKIRMTRETSNVFASGGKENELKLWDVETGKQIFLAKNLPHDWLQLRVPVWVSDMCFMENCEGKLIATCSRYGFVRLYDTRTQRRPVVSLQTERQPFNCISLGHRERHVLVGSGRGLLNLVDLRMKGKFDKSYKGSAGSITDVFYYKDQNVVVSTSLDRYLRIHDAETKEIVGHEYLTSKLTCFLLRTNPEPLFEQVVDQSIVKEELIEDVKEEEPFEEDEEYENLFNNMEVISDNNDVKKKKKKVKVIKNTEEDDTLKQDKKSKKKNKSNDSIKLELDNNKNSKKKHKLEESKETPKTKKMKKDPEEDAVAPISIDDSIKKLLKSSEKVKRKFEKKKKEKKAKSVFNN